ncbi:hypothetical protein BLA9940_00525 [Burkholderia aenigmatica]|uniref:hypothetical protein n=1 Tax=Burkholderia cepacia complex TaxID=87882 RepID=UPI0013DDF2F6|nr:MULTISPECIES: hypothetical protein [Burkholderia cepacia complex]VWC38776.1 hypothetical protein BLA9940_00525 [Burkholderia aenigmatica]
MNAKHTPIAGFRITRPTAKRGRPVTRHRLALSSEARQLLDALVATELHHSLARVMRKSAVRHDTRTANMPVSPPRRAAPSSTSGASISRSARCLSKRSPT